MPIFGYSQSIINFPKNIVWFNYQADIVMYDNIVIPEIDVLIHTALWLWRRKVYPFQFSLAQGKGIDLKKNRELLSAALNEAGIPDQIREFSSEGADVVGFTVTEWWQVECKGAGTGKKQTQRNNFDRALASVVSYYTDSIPDLPKGFENANPHLGLALPITRFYFNELERRVRKPLRQRLNLWVLLYDPADKTIKAVSPHDEYDSIVRH
jgi:hypothetical protein